MCAPRGEEIERSYSVVKAGPHMGGGGSCFKYDL